jgi:hypothetical protein
VLFRAVRVCPETKPANERVGVVTFAATRRERTQFAGVGAPEHDLLLEGGDQARDHVSDMSPPFLLTVSFQSATADIVLVGSFPVRKVTRFHGLDNAVVDQGRTKTRSQPRGRAFFHPCSCLLLHGCIVDNTVRAAECCAIIDPDQPCTGPGQPIDTTLYFHDPASVLRSVTICSG